MTMKKIYTLISGLLFAINILGQYPSYQWAGNMPVSNLIKCNEDLSGNVYVAGNFTGVRDFDLGPGSFTLNATSSSWGYIAKYTSSGSLIWAKAVITNSYSSCNVYIQQIKIDNAGNPCIVGTVDMSGYDFDPGAGVVTPPFNASPSYINGFVAKYDANGNYQWAQSIYQGSSGLSTSAVDLVIDNANNRVRIGGNVNPNAFSASMVYASTSGCSMSIPASFTVTSYGYVLSYDLTTGAGILPFTESYLIAKDTYNPWMEMDNAGNLYYVYDNISLSTGSNQQSIIVKKNSALSTVWTVSVGASGNNVVPSDISIDASNNVYVHGNFFNTVDFDASAATSTIASMGSYDSFLMEYSAAGTFIWAGGFGNTGYDIPKSVCINKLTNDIYLTCAISGGTPVDVDFGPSVTTFSTPSSSDFLLLRYDGAKNFIWGSVLTNVNPHDLKISSIGNLYMSGHAQTAFDFDFSSSVNSISSGGFVSKYAGCSSAPPSPAAISGSISICESSSQTYSIAPVSGAISYNWSTPSGFTGTSATNILTVTAGPNSGNITVTASNACGSSTAQVLTVQINNAPLQPSPISGTITMCAGSGPKTYSVTFSSSSLNYIWALPSGWTGSSTSNTISATPGTSGTISVVATYSCGTSPTRTLAVTVNTVPTASANTTQTLTCLNTTATLNGTGVSTYTWSGPGIVSGGNSSTPTASMAGTYSLVGTTSGCVSNTATVSLTTNTIAPSVSVTATTNSICIGNSATLTANGASTYSWSTSSTATSIVVSPTTTTNYILTGTNSVNGCTNTINKSIGVNSLPVVTANTSNSIICGPPFQGTTTITASGASSYTWNTSATTTNIAVSPSITTVYTVTGTDANGCVNSTSFTQSVSACTGIDVASTGSATGVIIYPNPTSGLITIKAKADLQLSVYNIIGELILSTELKTETIELDLSNQANGIYFIRIGSLTKKIIKQ
jgi:hypothetical protein